MSKNKRIEEILQILKNEGFAGVRDLGERLYASQPTIRRDLDKLEKDGLVRRSHGGAVLADVSISAPISFRQGKRIKEKGAIARLASTLIENGQLIFADGSTTALHLADCIKEKQGLRVVTNGIPLAQALAKKGVKVYSTGGVLLDDSMAFAGKLAEKAISGFFADMMFFSTASIDGEGIISDYSEEETFLRAEMRAHCKKAVYLCDSGKLESRSSFTLFSLSRVDLVVTDKPLPEDMAQKYGLAPVKEGFGAFMYNKKTGN